MTLQFANLIINVCISASLGAFIGLVSARLSLMRLARIIPVSIFFLWVIIFAVVRLYQLAVSLVSRIHSSLNAAPKVS